MLNEQFLSTIWKFKIFSQYPLKTTSGKSVEIIDPGEPNHHNGPDFLNAKIKIDHLLWAGNVEIHIKASDFLKHKHLSDKNYHSLILHIVYENDVTINFPHHTEIIELKNFISDHTIEKYQYLLTTPHTPACIHQWQDIPSIIIEQWLNRMMIERLQIKTQNIQSYFEQTKNYQEIFYKLFCKHLGFKANNDQFEKIAEKLPLKILLKHSTDIHILESLIYGTAGFLNKAFKDKYLLKLQNEFEFLRKKYNIESLEPHLWKFARIRPSNFPSLRLHQLALMIHQIPEMFHDPALFFQETKNLAKLKVTPQNYFSNHLTFDEDKFTHQIYHFGESAIHHILINVIVPYLFFYGKNTGEEKYQTLALDYLEKIPSETNYIIKKFNAQKNYIKNALHSQALLQLYPNYCEQKKCTNCAIGISILNHQNNIH